MHLKRLNKTIDWEQQKNFHFIQQKISLFSHPDKSYTRTSYSVLIPFIKTRRLRL